jgi:hypothetical protein
VSVCAQPAKSLARVRARIGGRKSSEQFTPAVRFGAAGVFRFVEQPPQDRGKVADIFVVKVYAGNIGSRRFE